MIFKARYLIPCSLCGVNTKVSGSRGPEAHHVLKTDEPSNTSNIGYSCYYCDTPVTLCRVKVHDRHLVCVGDAETMKATTRYVLCFKLREPA